MAPSVELSLQNIYNETKLMVIENNAEKHNMDRNKGEKFVAGSLDNNFFKMRK